MTDLLYKSNRANVNPNVLVSSVAWLLITFFSAAALAKENSRDGHVFSSIQAVLTNHCVECHHGDSPEAGIDLSKNNHELKQLQQTDAQLVWASTTPIRSSSTQIFDPGSEVAYNEIARELMESEGVAVCDMHAKVSDLINLERPSSFDPFDFEKKPIHPFIVKALLEHLQLD